MKETESVRVHRPETITSTIRTGTVVVNLDERLVSVDDQLVRLTGKEYDILELLSLRKDTILTKEMILEHLYGGIDEPELKIIDIFCLQAPKKACPGDWRLPLHRNGVGPRLCTSGSGRHLGNYRG
jgi:DNA-binding response OmpR family regulator